MDNETMTNVHFEPGKTITVVVPAEKEGERLDIFLTALMEGSRSYVQQLIKSGAVTVNHKVGKSNLKLTSGANITVAVPKPQAVEVNQKIFLWIFYLKIMILLLLTNLVAWWYTLQ